NNGPTNASSVVVTDVLPATVNFVSAVSSQGTCSNNSGIVTCDLGSLTNSGTATITLTVLATATGSLSNYVSLTSSEVENLPSNNSDTEFTSAGVADVGVTRVASPDPVVAGQVLTNTVTVTNRGPDTATSVSLGHFVSASMVVVGASTSQGTVSTSGNVVNTELGSIAAGAVATVTVLAVPTVSGTLFDSGSISLNESDPIGANNFFNNSVTVTNGSGVFQFQQSAYSISESGGAIVVVVERTGGVFGTVTVDFAALSGTATAGSDFTSTNGTLTFTNGELIQYFTVPITDDAAAECNESFTLGFSNPTGGATLIGNTNIAVEIFDNEITASGTITLASPAISGSASGYSFNPVISADGTRLVFASYATNLTAESNGVPVENIFLRNLLSNTVTLVSLSTNGTRADGYCEAPQIGADNRFVLFYSEASNLVPGADSTYGDYFLRDLVSGTTILVGPKTNGTGSANSGTYDGKMTPDGSFIAFESPASNIVTNDTNGFYYDIYLRNRTNATAELVSLNASGSGSGNAGSFDPVLSDDGRYVAFETDATDLAAVTDSNSDGDIYVRDRLGGSNILVSVNSSATGSGNAGSYDPLISADGRYVVFYSDASNLVANDTNNASDIFIRDLLLNTTALVSVKSSGAGTGNGASYNHSMTPSGRYVIFESGADDLVSNDGNGKTDVFI
ncbi:MAG: DUF11 domain-containing protein, partial [Verrucomicrobia bacterium]